MIGNGVTVAQVTLTNWSALTGNFNVEPLKFGERLTANPEPSRKRKV